MFDYMDNERQARRLLHTLSALNPADPDYGQQMARDLLDIREADASGKASGEVSPEEQEIIAKNRALVNAAIDSANAFTTKDLAINGNDLIAMGYKPGPEIGQILKALTDQVIDNPELNTREYLLSQIPQPT